MHGPGEAVELVAAEAEVSESQEILDNLAIYQDAHSRLPASNPRGYQRNSRRPAIKVGGYQRGIQ